MRRAAFATLYQASWLVLGLSCSSGASDVSAGASAAVPVPELAAGAGQGGVVSSGDAGSGAVTSSAARMGSDVQSAGGAEAGAGSPSAPGGGQAGQGDGTAGQAGVVGAQGGAAGAAPGVAGSSAGGSAAGTAQTGNYQQCAERCTNQSDCKVGTAELGFSCNPATKRCERPGFPCRDSVECLPAASLWFLDCDRDADCFYFSDDVCVSVGAAGKCARLASANGECWSPTPTPVTLARFGSAEQVQVCADASQKCERGACVPACHADTECSPARNGSLCDVASGTCLCVTDEDCGGPGVSHCNVATGSCECGATTDCEEVPGTDVCFEGRCRCSSAKACGSDTFFSGTSFVCE